MFLPLTGLCWWSRELHLSQPPPPQHPPVHEKPNTFDSCGFLPPLMLYLLLKEDSEGHDGEESEVGRHRIAVALLAVVQFVKHIPKISHKCCLT